MDSFRKASYVFISTFTKRQSWMNISWSVRAKMRARTYCTSVGMWTANVKHVRCQKIEDDKRNTAFLQGAFNGHCHLKWNVRPLARSPSACGRQNGGNYTGFNQLNAPLELKGHGRYGGVASFQCFERLFSTSCHKYTNEPRSPDHDKRSIPETVKLGPNFRDLKENVMTIPNLLTVSRIVLAPALSYLILMESYALACSMFIFVGITDVLDGWIARTFPSQESACGSFLDPLADKLLITVVFLSLTAVELIPWPLTGLVLARDFLLIAAAFYIRYITLPPPRSLAKYFDVTMASAQLKPTFISKMNTAVQLSLVGFTLGAPVFGYVDHIALQSLWYLTAGTTFASGLTYVFAKNTFEALRKGKNKL